MDTVRKITEELTIAGQPTLEQLQQLAEAGYQSVVNLRSPDEIGFLDTEQQQIEHLGLSYYNMPIQVENLNLDSLLPVVQRLIELPKPMLLHCDNGIRSSIIVLMQLAVKQGIEAEDAFQKVAKLSSFND